MRLLTGAYDLLLVNCGGAIGLNAYGPDVSEEFTYTVRDQQHGKWQKPSWSAFARLSLESSGIPSALFAPFYWHPASA